MTTDKRGLIRMASAILATSVLCAIAYLAFDRGLVRLTYPSRTQYPVRGIDVSHHQKVIDWARVAASSDIRFAYIKATEGGDYRDARFSENWQSAKRAGLIRGAYHFFTFCRPGRDQAVNFLETVPQEPDTLPPAVDLEFAGNCNIEPTLNDLITNLNEFVTELQKNDARKPIFYVTPEFFNRYMKDNPGRFPEHRLWLRSLFHEPSQKRCKRWHFWQFADGDRINGIEGAVDLNVFCGNETDLSELVRNTPHGSAGP